MRPVRIPLLSSRSCDSGASAPAGLRRLVFLLAVSCLAVTSCGATEPACDEVDVGTDAARIDCAEAGS
jgi:hypothetical protein